MPTALPNPGVTPPNWGQQLNDAIDSRYNENLAEIDGKVDEVTERTETDVVVRTDFNHDLTSDDANILENYFNGTLGSYLNEWGALRGTAGPDGYFADSLVRGILRSGENYPGVDSGNMIEIADRRNPPNVKLWGRRWGTGDMERNGVRMTDAYVSTDVGSDPNIALLPNGVLVLEAVTAASGAPVVQWNGDGLAVDQPVTTSSNGTGDTPIDAVEGSTMTTRSGGDDPPRIEFAQDGSVPCNLRWDLAATTTLYSGEFWIETPASWASSSHTIFAMAQPDALRHFRLNLSGSGAPGQLRLVNGSGATIDNTPSNTLANSTLYRIQFRCDTGTGDAAARVYDEFGALLDEISGNADFGGAVDAVQWGNPFTAPTVPTLLMDALQVTDTDEWISGGGVSKWYIKESGSLAELAF